MIVEAGPGPLGLCPVRGVTKVEQDSQIWVANLRLHPVEIEENQVVATAECVTETPGTCPEDEGSITDEVEVWYDARPHISMRWTKWTKHRDKAFNKLKAALTSTPIMGFPREDGQWYLDTDARTGAVLSQVQDREERVIASLRNESLRSMNWRDNDGGTNWSSQRDDKKTSSSVCTEERSGLIWGQLAPSL